jgi:hypothetical protein
MKDDDAEVAELSAHYLKIAFKAEGRIPVKVEILSPDHSMESVRATYKAWLVDPSLDDSFDDPRPTIHWEVGVAHFFREGDHHYFGESEGGWPRCRFIPKKDGKWEHNYNAVKDSGICDLDGPLLDEGVAEQWRRLKGLLSLGFKLDELPV